MTSVDEMGTIVETQGEKESLCPLEEAAGYLEGITRE